MVGSWGQKGVRQYKRHISSSHPENIFVYHCSVAKATPATYDIMLRWLSQAPQHCFLNVEVSLNPPLSFLFPKGKAKSSLVAKDCNERGKLDYSYIQLHLDHSHFIFRPRVAKKLCFWLTIAVYISSSSLIICHLFPKNFKREQ